MSSSSSSSSAIPVFLLIGSQAAGKSTVASLLADRFDRSAVVDLPMHDVVRSGRVGLRDDLDGFVDQLRVRYDAQAKLVDTYRRAGYVTVWTDVVFGPALAMIRSAVSARPLYVVALVPRPEVVAARERGRSDDAYGDMFGPDASVEKIASDWDRELRTQTPGVDLYLDTSELTPQQTVQAILDWAADHTDEPAVADGREELPLYGGLVNRVVRHGDVVKRPGGPWTPTIQALLGHLHDRGFPAPRPLGTDDDGRELVTYLPGHAAVWPWPEVLRDEEGLVQVGRLLRALSRGGGGLHPARSASW